MEQPIVIRFRWTADELLRAYDYQFRHTYRPAIRFALHFIFAATAMLGSCVLVLSRESGAAGVALIGIGTYWFVLRRFVGRWIARRKFRKRPDRDIEIEWQIAADTLRSQSSLSTSELSWQAFTKMVWTPSGVLLYPMDQIFHWLPRTGFASDAEFCRFVELAKSKIERHFEVA